jgi:hypothetical protein
MASFAWALQIYATTNACLQQAIVGRLRDLPGVNVEPASNGPNSFVIAESPRGMAQAVCDLVIQTDPLAVLVHEATGTDDHALELRTDWVERLA